MLFKLLKIGVYLTALLGSRFALAEPQADEVCQYSDEPSPFGGFPGIEHRVEGFTPVVDSKLMSHHITSRSPEISEKILLMINAIKEAKDPHISAYFDFVFTHLQGFKIEIYSLKEIQSIAPMAFAAYYPSVRTILLPEELPPGRLLHDFYGDIRHEMRHAAMHASHELLSSPESKRHADFFSPVTAKNSKKMEQLFAKGDKRLHEFGRLLSESAYSSYDILSAKDKQLFEGLRQQVQHEYMLYYCSVNTRQYTIDEYKHILKVLKQKDLLEKESVNIDFFQSQKNLLPLGPVKFTNVTILQKLNKVEVQFIILDPLYAALLQLSINKSNIEKFYREHERLYEREAQLVGVIPFPIINYLYSEIVNVASQHLENARNLPVNYLKPQHKHLSFLEFSKRLLIADVDEVTFHPRESKRFIGIANYFINIKEIQTAIKALEVVIKKGDPAFLNEATTLLSPLKRQIEKSDSSPSFFKSKNKDNIAEKDLGNKVKGFKKTK